MFRQRCEEVERKMRHLEKFVGFLESMSEIDISETIQINQIGSNLISTSSLFEGVRKSCENAKNIYTPIEIESGWT